MSRLRHERRTVDDFKKLPIVGKQPSSEKEDKFLREINEYEFLNLEEPNLAVRFPYGNAKHQHTFTFFPGGKYKVPRFIARWIESRTTPQWEWRPDGMGKLIKKQIGNKPRFQMRQVFGD